MSKFKISVARIELNARGKQDAQVRITFRIDRAPISFQVPILLSIRDFDDTEMVQAARSALHRTFVELAAQSQKMEVDVGRPAAAFEHELTSKDMILAHTRQTGEAHACPCAEFGDGSAIPTPRSPRATFCVSFLMSPRPLLRLSASSLLKNLKSSAFVLRFSSSYKRSVRFGSECSRLVATLSL
jgi:hypothetical protein